MEVLNGVVSKTIPSLKTNNNYVGRFNSKSFSSVCVKFKGSDFELRNLRLKVVNCGYENKGHLEYYGESNINNKGKKGKKGWNEVSSKKKMKLLKGLVKDLDTFSDLGFGFGFDCDANATSLVDDDDHNNNKSLIISQAAEVLLAQLKQLKSEEEKQKKKEDGDKKKCKNGKCDSSSSESESSDSECDEVIDMKNLRKTKETRSSIDVVQLTALEGSKNDQMFLKSDQNCSNMILETTLNKDASIEALSSNTLLNAGKRIEVCMGGKCKKSGAPTLIEEFQKAVGNEGQIVGCKCMGKCKSGPNVKVASNGVDIDNLGDDSMRVPSNSLYIGVGLQDVESIVASYFGEEMKGLDSTVAGVVASS